MTWRSRERETPVPQGDEVLVRVEACGVCHSDLHVWDGYFDMGGGKKLDVSTARELPFTLGHEIAGEVVAVGDTATGIVVGAKGVLFPWIGCGGCPICSSGNEHVCLRPRALGTSVDGGFSDYVILPHERYVLDYGNVPTELACTYACSGLTAYSAISKIRDRVDRSLVLIGAGGVGLAAVRIAQTLFDAELIVVEVDDAKLQAARDAGATHLVNAKDSDAAKQIKKLTEGGAAAVIDFVGSEASANLGFKALRKSGTLVVVGMFGGALSVSLPLLPLKNVAIVGSALGSVQHMRELMDLVRVGALAPIPVATRPMSEVQQALEDLRAGQVLGRVVLVP